jgi:hypothetical protein
VYTIQGRDQPHPRTLRGQLLVSAPVLAWNIISAWTGRGYHQSKSHRFPTLARRARSVGARVGALGLKRAPPRAPSLPPYLTSQKGTVKESSPCASVSAQNADGAAPEHRWNACPRTPAEAPPGALPFGQRQKDTGALAAACPHR